MSPRASKPFEKGKGGIQKTLSIYQKKEMWERKRMINRKKNDRNKIQFSVTTKIIISTNKFNFLSNT